MEFTGNTLLILLIILSIGLIVPELVKRIRLPYVSVIILAGALLGPNGLNYIEFNETIYFLGFLGMTFLMLMAGLESDLDNITKSKYKIFIMAFLNGFIPFISGIVIATLFGYDIATSLLIGVVFISSSVAVIVPLLEGKGGIKKSSANLMLSAVMVTDIISLIALGFIFQNTDKITLLPLPFYYIILFISLPVLFYIVPKFTNFELRKRFHKQDKLESRIRFIIVILIGVLVYFSVLGMHPILAAFLAGLSLSGVIKKDKSGLIFAKIHTIGYGLFVPVFFFIVGMDIDLSIFTELNYSLLLIFAIIAGSILSKFFSGFIAGKLAKLNNKESTLFGSITTTQLTTTLAVTYTASSLGLIDSNLNTAIVLLAVITTFMGPTMFLWFSKNK
ncbi:MAG: hypothetical protein GF349_03070 [Candidatus Magasanikbacteria bacterium]|nr:hypothetical protein [Candidatus Magasanikbacteria bacterium]